MSSIKGRELRDINLQDKHERLALKERIGRVSTLAPVKVGGPKKQLDVLAKGFEAPPYELEELNDVRSEFTPEEKIQAVMAYISTGNSDVAEQFCNVGARTIRYWKQRAKWWPAALRICRVRMAENLDTRFTEIIHTATEELLDRIQKGDVTYVNGRRRRTPVKARDLAQIVSTLFDKRAASRGDPTQITEKREGSTADQLEDLRDTFEDYAKKWQDEREKAVVSEQ